jgi:hypothetical protein
MPRVSMYTVTKPRKNAATIDHTIKKRKRVVMTFIQREEIIRKLQNGYSVSKISHEYNIAERTVYDIKSKGGEELNRFRSENPHSGVRYTFKTSDYPLVDCALKVWFYQARAANVTLSRTIVAMQAKLFHDELYPPNNEIQAWLNQDDSDPGWRTLSNEEIIADILNPQEAELEEEEVVVVEELLGITEEVVMSTVEALESIQKLTKWIQHQACNTVVQLKTSFELEQFIRDRQFANYSTQSTISFS